MTLLSTIQNAARALNIAVPTTVIGNSDLNAALLLRLAQEEGDELSRRHDWQNITFEKTHTTLAAQLQTGAIPSDYERLVYNAEIWNRTLSQKYTKVSNANAWQRLQLGLTGGVTGWWRIKANALYIYPAPTAGQTIAFEYVSKNWCESSGGTDQSAWAADTDVGLIPERLMTLGIIWRWKQAKSMAYAEELSTYEREVEKASGRDQGAGIIQTGPTYDEDGPPSPYWGGTINA